MALPLTRNTTYAALSQVLSADLNDIQDQTVNGFHGSITGRVAAVEGELIGAATRPTFGYMAFDGASAPSVEAVALPLKLPYGSTLEEIRLFGTNQGAIAPAPSWRLFVYDKSNGNTQPLVSQAIAAGAGDWEAFWDATDPALPLTVADETWLVMEIATAAALGNEVRVFGGHYQYYKDA